MSTTISSKDRLEAYLREHEVSFVLQHHPTAYTAQEVAESEHVPGNQVAKPVIVIADGQPVMLVVPASHMVQVSKLGNTLGAQDVRLADEREVEAIFADCEAGAIPPFGNLYGLRVYVDRALAEDDRIVFRAGTHTETICITYAEFARLVQPVVASIARHRQLQARLVEARRVEGTVLYRLADPRIAQAVDLLRAVHADLQRRRSASLGTSD